MAPSKHSSRTDLSDTTTAPPSAASPRTGISGGVDRPGTDITPHHGTEEIRRRLEQAELSFKALFDNSNDAILLVNRTTMKLVDANERASQVLGYRREELTWLTVGQLNPPTGDKAGRSLGEGLRVAAGDFAARVATKRGDVLDVAVTAWTVDLPGLPVVFALLRDLTRQRQVERELMLSARRMKQLFDISPTMTHVLDIHEEGFRLSWISENARRILGYTPEEILADPTWWYRGIHPDDQTQALQSNDDVIAKGASRSEYRFRHSDGSYRWTHEELRLVTDDDGTPVEVVGSWADITDRKAAEAVFVEGERRLREGQRMEAIANLAGGIAHDFNSLLTTISGYANLLLEESDHPEPDLEEIRTASERGAELVRQLLAFSRRQIVRLEPIDLNNVIARLERVLGRMIGDDITLHTEGRGVPAARGASGRDRQRRLRPRNRRSGRSCGRGSGGRGGGRGPEGLGRPHGGGRPHGADPIVRAPRAVQQRDDLGRRGRAVGAPLREPRARRSRLQDSAGTRRTLHVGVYQGLDHARRPSRAGHQFAPEALHTGDARATRTGGPGLDPHLKRGRAHSGPHNLGAVLGEADGASSNATTPHRGTIMASYRVSQQDAHARVHEADGGAVLLEVHMPVSLSIKNVPDEVAAKLRRRAKAHRRSLQGELLAIVEEAVEAPAELTPEELRAYVVSLGLRTEDDSVLTIRADRDGR
ncbi:MAG: PAS domain S-box protein [Actinobacteria bacterium]|nr:PAS domain S-box protein [Actinomycetota bacterium]